MCRLHYDRAKYVHSPPPSVVDEPCEEWRPVVGHEGRYEVSNLGRVRSLDRHRVKSDGQTMRLFGRLLRQHPDPQGYPKVKLYSVGWRSIKVHRLVAEAFLPPRPGATEVNHKDRDLANNRVENLEWVTRVENVRHANAVGEYHRRRGVDHPHTTLTEEDVRRIRQRSREGHTRTDLAAEYGVGISTISRIARGQAWQHVD